MGMLDGILGQIGGGDMAIDAIASKFGIPPELAEKAVAALGQSHAEEGDTIAGAAAKTGLDSGMLGQLADHLGGAGGLGQLSGLLQGAGGLSGLSQILDRDGDGNPLDDIAGIAKGLLG
jgi:ATP phosphoribosyltransferase regulatory subunit HisZ